RFNTEGTEVGGQRSQGRNEPRAQAGVPVPLRSRMRKINMGVLGVGEMGKRHAENLRRLVPGAELIAIADVAEARAKQVAEELEIEHAFGSLEAMLELKGLQAVLIATPDKFHAQAVIQ